MQNNDALQMAIDALEHPAHWYIEGCALFIECEAKRVNALTALRQHQQDGGWLPIETAPKDGRKMILLLTPSRFPQVAYSNTWWTAGFSVENKPTHWMEIEPLPAPPAHLQSQKQAGGE